MFEASTVTNTSLLVASKVEVPPVVYLYNSTIQFQTLLASAKKCVVKPQIPAGIEVRFGTPLSVAKLKIVPLAPFPKVILVVCVAAPVGVGLNCFLVGVPKALLVSVDEFI